VAVTCHWCLNQGTPQVWLDGDAAHLAIFDAAIKLWNSGPLNMPVGDKGQFAADIHMYGHNDGNNGQAA
jgi:hypothetical protein